MANPILQQMTVAKGAQTRMKSADRVKLTKRHENKIPLMPPWVWDLQVAFIDDLLAIFFALRRPELDIQAITTVTLPTAPRARLVKRLLRYLDRTDIPVAAGLQFPLRRLSEAEIREQNDFFRTVNHYAFAEPEDPRDQPL